MLGGVLALLSSMMFAGNMTTLRRGVITAPVYQAIAITVPIGVPLFYMILVIFDYTYLLYTMSFDSLFFFSLAGIVHLIIGRYCNYKSTQLLGATLAGPVTQLGLLVSIFFAFFVLGEIITLKLLIGISLIIIGPSIILFLGKENSKTKSGIIIDYKKGYIWGILCAISFGISPYFVKVGLNEGGVKESIVGAFIAYFSATILIFLIIIISKKSFREIYNYQKEGVSWFLLAGIFSLFAHLLRYMALGIAPISIVEPIQKTTIIFRVIFSWFINKKHEIINFKVLFGIFLSIVGVYFIIWQI